MSKSLVAVLLCAILVANVAAETGRTILATTQEFNCDGAKKLASVGNACGLLCSCAASLDESLKKDAKKKESETARCKDQCEKCKSAAGSCKSGQGLPDACKEGQSNNYVKQCINTWLKAQG